MIEKEFKNLEKSCKKISGKTYFCMAGAKVAAAESDLARIYTLQNDHEKKS